MRVHSSPFDLRFFCLLLLLLLNGCGGSSDQLSAQAQEKIYGEFVGIHSWYIESTRGGWTDNDDGRFSNDDAPAMEALLTLFEHTKDLRYAELIQRYGQKMLNASDEARNLRDTQRNNQILPGWSSTRYTRDKSRTQFLLDNALVALPMLAANRAFRGTEWRVYAPDAWLTFAERMFEQVFVPDWVQVDASRGYFQDAYYPRVEGLYMPANQYAIAGLLALELYRSTNKEAYLKYAVQTGRYLMSQLIVKDDSYVWCYTYYVAGNRCSSMDDFSHAQLIIRFVVEMYKAGQVFSNLDIERFKKTFTTQVIGPQGVYFYLTGRAQLNSTGTVLYATGAWLHYFFPLLDVDRSLAPVLETYLRSWKFTYDPASKFNHLGEFALLHFAFSYKYFGKNLCSGCSKPTT